MFSNTKMVKLSAPVIVDASRLTDLDWAELKKLNRAYKRGGEKAFSDAFQELGERNPFQFFKLVSALFPDEVKEAFEDRMTKEGMTEDDLRGLLETVDHRATKH